MEIIIEKVITETDFDAIMRIQDQVFGREMGIKVAPSDPSDNGRARYLIARVGSEREPVGSLCVLDTSNHDELHQSFELKFELSARAARYTHLAVLKPYRGMNIPLAMMIEAHRSVIVPSQFDYTWLLFDVERARKSFLSARLDFKPLPKTFVSEYGCRCALVRDERAPDARQAIRQAEEYLRQFQTLAMSPWNSSGEKAASHNLSQYWLS
jgi:hypothetical protein